MSESNPVEENVKAVAQEVEAVKQQGWLFNAVNELFATDPGNTVTLENGKVVTIKTAKVKSLKGITTLVQQYLNDFKPEEIVQLISMTSRAQDELAEAGENPFQEALSKMKSFVGGTELVLRITEAGLDIAPKLIEMFTDLTGEEFEELPMEEGAVVAYSVFGRNYHFFSQRVRPAVAGFIALRAKQQKKTG